MVLMMKRFLFLAVAAGMLSACVRQSFTDNMNVRPVSFDSLSGWTIEDHAALVPMVRRECHLLAQLPPETSLGGGRSLPYGRQVVAWSAACAALSESNPISDDEARRYFENWFKPYEISGGAFYTGYYEPQIEASLERAGAYQVPLYRRPADLLQTRMASGETVFGRDVDGFLQPYDDRATIDDGSLAGKQLEIAWLKDPVDLFFLQIQGSGRLHLPDGSVVRVAYDGRNGQPYVPIGRILLQEGALQPNDVTDESIRAWLTVHPEQVKRILEKNPNYVFFRLVEHSSLEGPGGAFGLPLTPGRSVAIDRHFVPFAVPVWVETPMPDLQGQEGQWHRLTFAQDVGTDVRGPGRADIFTGWGEKAHFIAGHLRGHGRMFVFLPRPQADELPQATVTEAQSESP